MLDKFNFSNKKILDKIFSYSKKYTVNLFAVFSLSTIDGNYKTGCNLLALPIVLGAV